MGAAIFWARSARLGATTLTAPIRKGAARYAAWPWWVRKSVAERAHGAATKATAANRTATRAIRQPCITNLRELRAGERQISASYTARLEPCQAPPLDSTIPCPQAVRMAPI